MYEGKKWRNGEKLKTEVGIDIELRVLQRGIQKFTNIIWFGEQGVRVDNKNNVKDAIKIGISVRRKGKCSPIKKNKWRKLPWRNTNPQKSNRNQGPFLQAQVKQRRTLNEFRSSQQIKQRTQTSDLFGTFSPWRSHKYYLRSVKVGFQKGKTKFWQLQWSKKIIFFYQ